MTATRTAAGRQRLAGWRPDAAPGRWRCSPHGTRPGSPGNQLRPHRATRRGTDRHVLRAAVRRRPRRSGRCSPRPLPRRRSGPDRLDGAGRRRRVAARVRAGVGRRVRRCRRRDARRRPFRTARRRHVTRRLQPTLRGESILASHTHRLRLLTVLGALLAAASIAPAASAAAQRYAGPTGSGTACSSASPCPIKEAVEAASGGDEVIVAPGDYTLTTTLKTPYAITIHGVAGQPRPRLLFSGLGQQGLWVIAGSTLRYVEVDQAPGNDWMALYASSNSLVDQVIARASGAKTAVINNSTIRNSLERFEQHQHLPQRDRDRDHGLGDPGMGVHRLRENRREKRDRPRRRRQ